MIAVLVGALVMTAVYSVFTTAVRTERGTQKALTPLRGARYAFTVLEKDIRNLDPFCLPQDIHCKDSSCLFPVVDESGKRIWVEYKTDDKELKKIIWSDSTDGPDREKQLSEWTLCRDLSKAVFETVSRGNNLLPEDSMDERRTFPGMIDLKLVFGENESPRNTYRSSVLLEITPQPLNAQ
ncbi:MAG: hypothetical protein BA863_06580 [Desulfovibrio sp. S3730MH75]|nr:MAG: hypothetical protein BA863_06580 [Desulfovibrio sp. S3730MH75]